MSASDRASSGILLTGGSGLLGSALRALVPEMLCPASYAFDITDYAGMLSYLEGLAEKPKLFVHAAAFTNTHAAPQRLVETLEKNIAGTCNIVKLCEKFACKLVYISTDYVFRGDRGNYSEEDELHPTNSYAWSKLGGECAVRMYPNSLIVRSSFGPEPFPFAKAFTDLWTSKLGVSELARRLVPILHSRLTGVIHIGSPRRTVMEYAVSVSPGKSIGAMSIRDTELRFPKDTSLDCSKYRELFDE